MSADDKPTIPELVDAARLLHIDLLWDPDTYPQGPRETERDLLMTALSVGVENYRGMEVSQENLSRMRVTHGLAFGHDATQMTLHAVSALYYHAEMLKACTSESGAVQDATGLIRTAASILATTLAQIPYRHADIIRLMAPCDVRGCPCGGQGSVH